jgi:sugar lactone lactonase YvrE
VFRVLRAAATVRFALACVGFLAACFPAAAATGDAVPQAAIDTYAGSGRSGLADGPGAEAEFIAPAGLAVDAAGRVYVADRGAQRIKVVEVDRTVRTLAGSGDSLGEGLGVPGGYRDGPAATARFNQPLGVAVAADGSVYVADVKNHCIRLVRNGMVSTYAGSPARAGDVDGAAGVASFAQPRAVALASDGRLFVADYPNGLRVVAPDGRVSSYPIAKREESALLSTVAIVPENGNDYLLASSVTDFYQVDLTHNLLTNDIGVGTPDGKNHVAYGTLVGPPTAIGGILTPTLPGIGTIVFPDAFYSEVVVCYFSNCKFLSSPPRFDASFHGGGYRDGPAPEALFEQPEGIAASRDGTIYVADTGNKRIRRITSVPAMLPGLNYGESILSKFPQVRSPDEYRIALVGNSYVDGVLLPDDGIAAHLEHRLAPLLAARGKRVEIYPLGIPGIPRDAALSLVEENFSTGLADLVVLDLPLYFEYPSTPSLDGTFPEHWGDGSWLTRTRARLVALTKTLAAAGVPLYIYAHPISFEIPGEMVYGQFPKRPAPHPMSEQDDELNIPDPSEVARLARAVASLASDPSLHFIDFYPAFLAEHSKANNHRLFASWDHHFAPYAAALVGDSLGDRIARDAPWSTAP